MLKYCGAISEKHLEVSKFLSSCKLDTHHHVGKIWTKIKKLVKIGDSEQTKNSIFLGG